MDLKIAFKICIHLASTYCTSSQEKMRFLQIRRRTNMKQTTKRLLHIMVSTMKFKKARVPSDGSDLDRESQGASLRSGISATT